MNKAETITGAEVAPSHPLEPLAETEIAAAAALVRAKMPGAALRFELIQLKEPPKSAVRAFSPGDPVRREAKVNVYKMGQIGVWEFAVSLTDEVVLSETFHPAARPMIMLEEFMQIEDVVKADPAFQAERYPAGFFDADPNPDLPGDRNEASAKADCCGTKAAE